MKVAVLGCGPAGLVAAHAAQKMGAEVYIYSKRQKSELFGAQYLHEPIPGIEPGEARVIRYQLHGTVEDYRRKVYGARYDGSVSPQGGFDGHPAWDIRRTYDALWALYNSWVQPARIHHKWLLANAAPFDAVLSTVPAPCLCHKDHHFDSQEIWAYGDAPERGQLLPPGIIQEGSVICNGRDFPSWYRASRIFGYATLEWSAGGPPSTVAAARVRKPISTDCDCWPGVIRLGRYGQWKKGVLVHQVYEEAQACLSSLSLR